MSRIRYSLRNPPAIAGDAIMMDATNAIALAGTYDDIRITPLLVVLVTSVQFDLPSEPRGKLEAYWIRHRFCGWTGGKQ